MKTKLVLFDIDGTMVLTKGLGRNSIQKSFCALFPTCNFEQPLNTIDFTGKTDPLIFQEVATRVLARPLSLEELALLRKTYITQLEQEFYTYPEKLAPAPGIHDLLPALREQGIALALQTGNVEEGAFFKLRAAGIEQHFSCGGFGSDSDDRATFVDLAITRAQKTHGTFFTKEEIVLIGDAPQDMAAAKANGIHGLLIDHLGKNLCPEYPHKLPSFNVESVLGLLP